MKPRWLLNFPTGSVSGEHYGMSEVLGRELLLFNERTN